MGEPMATLTGLAVIVGAFALIIGIVWLFSKWGLGGIGAIVAFLILAFGSFALTENIVLSISLMILAVICCVFIQLNQAEANGKKKEKKTAKAA